MNEFYQLKRGNDWGSVYFSHDPLVESRYGNRYASRARGWAFKDGQPRSVRFPDGTEGVIVIRTEQRHRASTDHGHETSWYEAQPLGSLSMHGLIATFDLDTHGLLIEHRPDLGDPP